MSSREETLDLAAQAKSLLDHPAFQKAFNDVRNALYEQIDACPMRDKEGLYELKVMLKLLRDLRANLEQSISDGKLVEVEIEREKNPRNFLGNVIHGRR